MRGAVRIAMLCAIALATYVAMTARQLGIRSDLGPGAGFFPFALALLLGGLAALWLVLDRVSVLRRRGADAAWPEGPPPRGAAALRLLGLCVTLLFAAMAMEPAGFPVTVFATVLLMLLLFEERRPQVLVPVSLLAGPGFYAAFVFGLGVALPAGFPFGSGG